VGVSVSSVAVVVLLTFGVTVELACCLGVLVMSDAYDKLHYLGPAAIVGPLAIAAAVVVRESLSQAGVKALLVAALLMVASPVLTHATARALYIRRRDHLDPEPTRRGPRT
jgi:monovalent cation/proton antiporter MnhG/PhaG subunit